jgi:hypothetical protein
MKAFRILVLILPLLTGCASTQQRTDLGSVQSSGVSSRVYGKMEEGDDLSIADIQALARAKVGRDVMLRYLREHRTIYHLSRADERDLRAAGVAPALVDEMGHSAVAYALDPYDQ